MTAYLPPRPDLGHLKREAKSLLKSHRQGDNHVCPILRRLHRFSHASDSDILASEVKLNEVQFALALEYGFSSWNALKRYVEELMCRADVGSLMDTKEFRGCIDDGAHFYIRMIADAEHMEIVDNGIYEIMRSRGDINNMCVVYNIRLDHLSDEEIVRAIQEIKGLKMHTWWPHLSERVLDIMHGRGKRPAWAFDDTELYGIMLADEMPRYPRIPSSIRVSRVRSQEEFQTWCDLDNEVEHSGDVHIHPQNHYHLIENEKLRCYLGYVDGIAATTAAILNNEGTASLEFTVTTPEHRQRGYAKAVCQLALKDAFKAGIKIVSVRAIGNARMLGKSLGFKYDAPSDSIWSASQTS